MKKLAILFSLLLSVAFVNNAGAFSTSQLVPSEQSDYCGVTDQDIIDYMLDVRGETVNVITPIEGSCDVIVDCESGRRYRVYIKNGVIGNTVEIPIG